MASEDPGGLRVAMHHSKSFHQQFHHLRPGQQRRAQSQRDQTPGMGPMPKQEIAQDVEGPRGKHGTQTQQDASECLPQRSRSRHRAQQDQQHGEERQEHVKGDSLCLSDAVGKDAAQSAAKPVKESFHGSAARLYWRGRRLCPGLVAERYGGVHSGGPPRSAPEAGPTEPQCHPGKPSRAARR